MRLTKYATVIDLSRRRESGRWRQVQEIFEEKRGRPVKFHNKDTGKMEVGTLLGVLQEGVLLVRTKDGKEYDVLPEEMEGVEILFGHNTR